MAGKKPALRKSTSQRCFAIAERARRIDHLSPLNEVILGKIERGERANLDGQTLLSLADTLRLTIGERREFFLAATGLQDKHIYVTQENPEEILASVLRTLREIQLPALLVDRYLDVVAVNSIALKMYNISQMNLYNRLDSTYSAISSRPISSRNAG